MTSPKQSFPENETFASKEEETKMNNQDSLLAHTFEVEPPSRFFQDRATRGTASTGVRTGLKNADLLAKVFDKVTQGGRIVVEFSVPRAIKQGIEAGEYIRKGGVIVTADAHHVVHWLREGSVVRKTAHAVRPLTVLIDLWSEYALNEKLKQISIQLERIEGKIDAGYLALFRSAHDSLKKALTTQNAKNQNAWFLESLHRFEDARNQSIERLKAVVTGVDDYLHRYNNAAFHNYWDLLSIYESLETIPDLADRITHCYRAESGIFERLNDPENGIERRTQTLNFQLAICEYASFFADGSCRYKDLELVQSFRPHRHQAPDVGGGRTLLDQIKHPGRFYRYFPAQILRKKIASVTGQSSKGWQILGDITEYPLIVLDPLGSTGKWWTGKGNKYIEAERMKLVDQVKILENRIPASVFEITADSSDVQSR
jgi:hypothetical protein